MTEPEDLMRLADDGNPHVDQIPAPDHSEYDAETVRLVMEAEREVGVCERELDSFKAMASEAKKTLEASTIALRKLIRDREEMRGKRPAPTLLDMIDAPAKWRELPVSALKVDAGILNHLSFDGLANLGQLWDEITSFDPSQGTPFGLALADVATVRMAIAELNDAERPTPAAVVPDDLWRSYPIERWTRYGITAKDLEKLGAGEVKKTGERFPIATVGDLSNFSKPSASGWVNGYADIKGIGSGGADRISDAEAQFWSAWANGLDVEYARERGLIGGNATSAGSGGEGTGGSDPGEESGDGTKTYDTNGDLMPHDRDDYTLSHDIRTNGI